MPPKKSGRGRKKVEPTVTVAEDQQANDTELPTAGRKRGRAESEEVLATNDKAPPAVENGHVEEEPAAAKKRGRPKNAAESNGQTKDVTESEAVPKNAKRGRKASPENLDSDEKAKQEPETKETASEEVDETEKQEPEEVASRKTRGRSRNAKQAVKEKEAGPSSVIGDRVLQVSLLRQKSLDDMALEEQKKSEEEKPKSAAGAAKPRGKRALEGGEDSGKPTKARKGAAASAAKKIIPEVRVLDFSNTSTTKSGEDWNLKIASWNINGVRAWLEKEGVSYLCEESPDVVCLQETKCSDEKLPKEANVDGYHCYWLAGDKDGYSGVGMLAKKKPLNVEYGIGMEEHDSEGRVITADFDKFYLVAAYVPNAGRGLVRLDYRKKWDVDFRAYLKKLDKTKPVILCGDLNVAHKEIDLANPKTNKKNAGFTQEERDGFSALLKEGFVDTYRHLYPNKTGAYTFWTYMMNARAKNVGWRLDYFVMSERFKDRLCDCCIRSEVMGSDHCPLVLFLNI